MSIMDLNLRNHRSAYCTVLFRPSVNTVTLLGVERTTFKRLVNVLQFNSRLVYLFHWRLQFKFNWYTRTLRWCFVVCYMCSDVFKCSRLIYFDFFHLRNCSSYNETFAKSTTVKLLIISPLKKGRSALFLCFRVQLLTVALHNGVFSDPRIGNATLSPVLNNTVQMVQWHCSQMCYLSNSEKMVTIVLKGNF